MEPAAGPLVLSVCETCVCPLARPRCIFSPKLGPGEGSCRFDLAGVCCQPCHPAAGGGSFRPGCLQPRLLSCSLLAKRCYGAALCGQHSTRSLTPRPTLPHLLSILHLHLFNQCCSFKYLASASLQ